MNIKILIFLVFSTQNFRMLQLFRFWNESMLGMRVKPSRSLKQDFIKTRLDFDCHFSSSSVTFSPWNLANNSVNTHTDINIVTIIWHLLASFLLTKCICNVVWTKLSKFWLPYLEKRKVRFLVEDNYHWSQSTFNHSPS